MILGADNQNSNLSKAASKRIDTSSRTKTANSYAAKISSTKNNSSGRETGEDSVESISPRSQSQVSPDPIKGSYEGLVKQSSGHIQMTGDGYDSPFIQSARYSQKSGLSELSRKKSLDKLVNKSLPFKKNAIITNYSSKFTGNNIANKMNEYLKTNNFFR